MNPNDTLWRRIYFIVGSFRPRGGILRTLCFAHHARELGYEPVICCRDAYDPNLPLFKTPRINELSPENGVEFTEPHRISVRPGELAFFSGVGLYEPLVARLQPGIQHEQMIEAVRGVLHANPRWIGGLGIRLLSRPMARMVTNDIVMEAIRPYLNPSSFAEVITVGHDTEFFYKKRSGGLEASLKVAHTAWKSNVGDRVARLLSGSGFEFRAVREWASWHELRELYHWADVFLATPMPEEGFYLPGLEAMAAGAIVLTPDAVGNRTYCRFGENCLLVEWEDESSYAETLWRLTLESPERIASIRAEGYETLKYHTWDRERNQFGAFLKRLTTRLELSAPGID